MAQDFIKILQEVRGTGAPEDEYTDGIYYDIAQKPTDDDGITPRLADGMYKSIQVMYGPTSVIQESLDDVLLVADSIIDVNTVATDIVSVNTVAPDIANVNIIANNMDDVNYFADIWQGPKAVAPILRNDGSALQDGDLYFDTVSDTTFKYNNGAWTTLGSISDVTSIVDTFTAEEGQTVFTTSEAYDIVYVYMNGRKLINGEDVDITAGSSFTLLGTAATTGDRIEAIIYGMFNIADHYTTTQTDTLLNAKIDVIEIGTSVQAYDMDTTKNDVANTFTAPQRTSTTAEDNAISFDGNNNFTLAATATTITVTSQTIGQSGFIIILSSENITGWGTEFDWGDIGAPVGMTGKQVFAYFISGASGALSIEIGKK